MYNCCSFITSFPRLKNFKIFNFGWFNNYKWYLLFQFVFSLITWKVKIVLYLESCNFEDCMSVELLGKCSYEWKSFKSCPTLCDPMDCSPWNSPGQNTGMGRLFLLQGIFPTQGLNPGLLHCRQILYQLSHKESPNAHNYNNKLVHFSSCSWYTFSCILFRILHNIQDIRCAH